MKRGWVLVTGLAALVGLLPASNFDLLSPDGRIRIQVTVTDQVFWSLEVGGREVVLPSPVSLILEGGPVLGRNPVLNGHVRREIHRRVHPVVPVKNEEIIDRCRELELDFRGGYGLIFRVYDQGMAYRWVTRFGDDIRISEEKADFSLAGNYPVYFPREDELVSHYERSYQVTPAEDIPAEHFASLPVLVRPEEGPRLLITEADLVDYPAMFLSGSGERVLRGLFPPVVLKTSPASRRPDRSEKVKAVAAYIALTRGTRSFPWRVVGVAMEDRELLLNQLVYLLSSEPQTGNWGWVKPGKVAWDWWNALNIFGVDFRSGINTQTYRYYIDFAARYGLEYVILDEGWSRSTTDLTDSRPRIDLPGLVAYGRDRGVGIILWVLWKPLQRDMPAVLDRFQKWGAAGIKVDFMQRADQAMVRFYRRTAREAAGRHLVVDFHGAFKPAGLRRAYPNVLSYEGVKGLEHCKWSRDITPDHDCTLPFIRMVAGPMDYTPGAMVNAQKDRFHVSFTRPMSQGTRCHQLALYVLFESPLQMLCDSPSRYLQEPEYTRFLTGIPTTWDETVALAGKVGDYLVMARRKGGDWFLAAITDWTPRDFSVVPSFLDPGEYRVELYRDGVNADRYASDFQRERQKITRTGELKIHLQPGGGWVARIHR